MIKDKLLSKTTKFMLSSSFVSIIISMCLLVNLFSPGLSTVVRGNKSGTTLSEYHTCGCITGVHSLDLCCCGEEAGMSGMKCLPEIDPENALTSFIQSLACAGIPDQFTPISYNVSLPEDGIFPPGLFLLNYTGRLLTAFPDSIKISPPYKPPRII